MTSSMTRVYRFNDATFSKDRSTGSKLDAELQGFADILNNILTGLIPLNSNIFTAPDGKFFRLSVVYMPDGVTPMLDLQQVTLP